LGGTSIRPDREHSTLPHFFLCVRRYAEGGNCTFTMPYGFRNHHYPLRKKEFCSTRRNSPRVSSRWRFFIEHSGHTICRSRYGDYRLRSDRRQSCRYLTRRSISEWNSTAVSHVDKSRTGYSTFSINKKNWSTDSVHNSFGTN